MCRCLLHKVCDEVCERAAACAWQAFDIETGSTEELLNLNPDGWIEGVTTEKEWRSCFGLDVQVRQT
jgi:hypothetical protein